jgi:hypothetical protein
MSALASIVAVCRTRRKITAKPVSHASVNLRFFETGV